MPLNTVTTGNTILAADINQLVQVLQRAAGQTETGKYHLGGSSYTNGALVSMYMPSLSRTTAPVSASIDTSDTAPSGLQAAPSTGHLTANGFQVFAFGSGTTSNCNAGGNYTIQY